MLVSVGMQIEMSYFDISYNLVAGRCEHSSQYCDKLVGLWLVFQCRNYLFKEQIFSLCEAVSLTRDF